MAIVSKQDSNITELRYAEELSPKVLPGTPEWIKMEPNSYNEFGGEITNISREPINSSRQVKKGPTTDLDASGGVNQDLTYENMQDILQGFFFADLRIKGEELPNSVTVQVGDDTYDVTSSAGFLVGSLANATGFTDPANNGIKNVTGIDTIGTNVAVAEVLVNEGSPPALAEIVVVGHKGAAGDIDVDDTGTYPAITSTALDFTTLGIIPGEWIFIGGDAALSFFTTAANNGFKRVRSVAANRVEFDKSYLTMVTEASTTETLELYFGRLVKNETGSLIKRRSYQLERQLGAPDDALPAQVQSEYLVGSVPNEMVVNITQADKISMDLSFLSMDTEQRTGVTGLKTGNRPALEEADAYNTSSDFSRVRMSKVVAGDAAPVALFAFVTDLKLTVSNNLSPDKAVAVLGAFDITAGRFTVNGDVTAYFADITAVSAVRNNDDVTMDLVVVKSNKGVVVDIPLIALGDGRLDVQQDQAIKIPLSMEAATAAKIDAALDYTALIMFFDYLPNLAV